jgi:hypothetical protein
VTLPDLSRALRALAHETVVIDDRASPCGQGVEPTAQLDTGVIQGGRATSVPFTAVLTGPQRTTTDNAEAPSTCTAPHLCR